VWYFGGVTEAEKYLKNAETTAILMDAGIELMRQNLRRRNPGVDEGEVTNLLTAWLRRMDDPIPGDTAGQVRIRERLS